MVILSLDLSLRCTGYCVYETENDCILSANRIFSKKKKDSNNVTDIAYVLRKIERLINDYAIEEIVVEDIFVGASREVSLTLARLRGAIEWLCAQYQLTLHSCAPSLIKKTVTSNSHADKREVFEVISRVWYHQLFLKMWLISGFYEKELVTKGHLKSDDVFDAIAIMYAFTKAPHTFETHLP